MPPTNRHRYDEFHRGLVPQDHLGTGSAGMGLKYLADDQTWKTPEGGTGDLPGGVTGLWSWFAADSISGLSDGDPVAVWPNSAQASFEAIGVGASLPTFKTSIVNSLPVVRFSGSNYLRFTSHALASQGWSLFVVFKLGSIVPSYTGVVGFGATSDGGGFFVKSTGKTALFAPSGVWDGTGSITYGTSDWNYTSVIFARDSSTVIARRNGSADVTDDPFAVAGTTMTGMIGNQSVAGRLFTGDIAEVLIYARGLSATDTSSVESYLATKYGL